MRRIIFSAAVAVSAAVSAHGASLGNFGPGFVTEIVSQDGNANTVVIGPGDTLTLSRGGSSALLQYVAIDTEIDGGTFNIGTVGSDDSVLYSGDILTQNSGTTYISPNSFADVTTTILNGGTMTIDGVYGIFGGFEAFGGTVNGNGEFLIRGFYEFHGDAVVDVGFSAGSFKIDATDPNAEVNFGGQLMLEAMMDDEGNMAQDTFEVAGEMTFTPGAVIDVMLDFEPTASTQLDFITGDQLNGIENVHIRGSAPGRGANFRFELTENGLSTTVAPVPLPASGVLMIAGLAGIAALRRRRAA